MLGLWTPVGFWVGQEASHLVGLGIASSSLRSAEVGLQLWLLGQQLTSCTAIRCRQSVFTCPHEMFSDARQPLALLIREHKAASELVLMIVLLPKDWSQGTGISVMWHQYCSCCYSTAAMLLLSS